MAKIDVLTLVQWIISVRLQEEILQTNHDRIEVQHWLPVFSQDVETDVSFEVHVRVVDLHHRTTRIR